MSYINVCNLSKVYGKKGENCVKALNDMELNIEKGEFVAIEGTSGSGKSTFLHILAELDRSTSGNILVDGRDITMFRNAELAQHRNKTIGIVLQDFYLIEYRTVMDNVMVPLMFSKKRISNIKDKAEKVLTKLNIAGLRHRKINQLSGGQKQRVAIARAIINNPDIILADEPTGALDSKTTNEILEVFKLLNDEGKTVVIVTHDPLVSNFAKRKIRIEDGAVDEDSK